MASSTTTTMMADSNPTLYLFSFETFFLVQAILLAYMLSNTLSLRNYLAVMQLDDAPKPETDEEIAKDKRRKRLRITAAITSVLSLWYLELYLIANEQFSLLNSILAVLGAMLALSATSTLFSSILGVKRAAFRRSNGVAVFLRVAVDRTVRFKSALAVFAAAGLLCHAVLANNKISRILTIACVVAHAGSRGNGRASSIRKMTIHSVVMLAFMIGVALVMIFLVNSAPENDVPTTPAPTEADWNELVGDDTYAQQIMLRLYTIVMPALYAIPVGQYIACLARFDYAQAKAAGVLDTTRSIGAFEAWSPRETCFSSPTSTGRQVPGNDDLLSLAHYVPFEHQVYSKLALRVAAVCYLIIAPAVHMSLTYLAEATGTFQYTKNTGSADSKIYQIDLFSMEALCFALITMFITIPVLAIAVALKARARGEKKALWTYDECWVEKPIKETITEVAEAANAEEGEGAIALSDEEKPLLLFNVPEVKVQDVDADTLPAYEVDAKPLIDLEQKK